MKIYFIYKNAGETFLISSGKKKENLQQSVCRQTEDEVERRKATVEVSITEKVQDVLRWYELCFR